ncbi:MAG TPA: GNAT family N-acetyltransferase, partial [Vicinamibacterales bacterium]|nr:GNAT family N-acetyltransferase [Vicinamibacterales bacterium]
MSITIRRLRPDESRVFLEIHGRSVHGLARTHYPPEILHVWAAPVTPESIRRFEARADSEIRLIAELLGIPAGVGCLSLRDAEVTACYVVPEAARRGVGTALMREMERVALSEGMHRLTLLASLNAESFYSSLGYE